MPDNGCDDKAHKQVADTNRLLSCRRLGVSVIAPPAGLKAAYRREALKTHPDVNDAPDAEQRFAELSEAYGERTVCAALQLHVQVCALSNAMRLPPHPTMHITRGICCSDITQTGRRSCMAAD